MTHNESEFQCFVSQTKDRYYLDENMERKRLLLMFEDAKSYGTWLWCFDIACQGRFPNYGFLEDDERQTVYDVLSCVLRADLSRRNTVSKKEAL